MKRKELIFLITALLIPGGLASAGEPVAIVEEVKGPQIGVQQMDLLEQGRVIKLQAGTTLTLGYLGSCVRETITGGSVTIGQEKSKVENGTRLAKQVDCDGGRAIKLDNRGNDVAGVVFRKVKTIGKKLPKPQWTIFGTDPVMRLSKPGTRILITRLDKDNEKPIDLAVGGLIVDLSKAGIQLEPGGLYSISDLSATFILKVSPLAVPGAPLLSRLIPM